VVGVSPKNEGVIQVQELTLNKNKEIEPVKWTTEHGISCATLAAAPTLSSKHLAYGDSQGNIRIAISCWSHPLRAKLELILC